MQVLRAIASGITDARTLSNKVTKKIIRRDEAKKALTNCLGKQHIFVIQDLLEQYDHINEKITRVENELFDITEPYRHLIIELKKSQYSAIP